MKKIIIILFLIIVPYPAVCDVIFFPYPFTGVCYSAEFIYSLEKVKKAKKTTNFWGGIGYVGSFYYRYEPTFGFELAIEKRHYFHPDKFKNFFISAYLGTALMTDFRYNTSIGLVPGVKINYKAQLSKKLILEPYLSLSLPITYDLTRYSDVIAFPALTIGARIGLSKLKNRDKYKT